MRRLSLGIALGLAALALLPWLLGNREAPARRAARAPAAARATAGDPRTTPRIAKPATASRTPRGASNETAAPAPAPETLTIPSAAHAPPPPGLGVRVLDASGAPAEGVQVELLIRYEGVLDEGTLAEAHTDAGGLARLASPEQLARLDPRSSTGVFAGLEGEWTFRVAATFPCSPRPGLELGSAPDWNRTVELVLPPTGSVAARIRTPDGDALPTNAGLFASGRAGNERPLRIGWARVDGGGRAVLERVPLGRELLLRAGGAQAYASSEELSLPGLNRADEHLEVELTLGPRLARVTGRLVGLDGIPLANVPVDLACLRLAPGEPGPAQPQYRKTPTDDEGRFDRSLSEVSWPRGRLVVVVHERSRDTASLEDRHATFDGVVEAGPGETVDVGTLVLRPNPDRRLLARGTVQGADGGPLRGAAIDAGFRDPKTDRWVRLPEDRVIVEPDGSFEIWSVYPDPPERFRATASAREHLGSELWVRPGSTVEFTLERSGALAGRVVAAEPAALPMLAVRIESAGHSRNPNIALGRFHTDVPPGTYTVSALAHGTEWRLGTVEGVVVERGRTTRDPRLDPLDLGNACRVLHLELRGPGGAALGSGVVWVRDPAGKGGSYRTDGDGQLVALVPGTTSELTVWTQIDGVRLEAVWSASMGAQAVLALMARH